MNAQRWQQIRSIFEEAVKALPHERAEFLRRACGGDKKLREEIELMLLADSSIDPILDQPILHWEAAQKQARVADLPFNHIGPYKLVAKLGEGGMGEVYQAVRENPRMTVVIKLIRERLPAREMERFKDERQILADLNHPNIVKLLDGGQLPDGRPYFVMEFVAGQDLQKRLQQGPLPLAEAVEITKQVSAALSAAHHSGIIHRDIKPMNLMLAQSIGEPAVKVLDFGIAVLKEPYDAQVREYTRGFIGTPAYGSPEQAAGKKRDEIDHRSDIYSLGAVVYEMLTGERLFKGATITDVLLKQQSEKPVPPSARRPDLHISAAVDRAVLKALEKNPEDRYSSAQKFAQALAEAAQEKARVWPKYLLPLAAALLLALGGGLGYRYLTGSKPPIQSDSKTANSTASDQPGRPNQKLSDATPFTNARPATTPFPIAPPPAAIARKLRLALLVQDEFGQPLEKSSFALFKPELAAIPKPIGKEDTLAILMTGKDGKKTSPPINITPGTYWVKVVRAGYQSLSRQINLAEDSRQPGYVNLQVTLKRE